jgi:dUTP pyrophosphatase
MIPTGVAIGLPGPGCVGLVYARSGLAVKHGIALSNGVGVIDSDYRGEIIVGLCNLSDAPYTIEPGERIAQLVVAPVFEAEIIETNDLDSTSRSAGGFGSTGRY